MQDGGIVRVLMNKSDETVKLLMTILLTPLSYIYGAVVYVRNKMFDWNILKSTQYDIPVISIGNIVAGGTGKTPHTEYIVQLLRGSHTIGVVSRGYKRRTSGFVLASSHSTPSDIGDEPFQIYNKFQGEVKVAVCEKRTDGIAQLRKIYPEIDVILLDDAFQHRYVSPSISIVLTEYNKPYYQDRLLPLGRLRESAAAIRKRADIVIITKCPEDTTPLNVKILKKQLDLFPYQKLFFSRYTYGSLKPIFPEVSRYIPELQLMDNCDSILTVTGIANPMPLIKHLKSYKCKVKVMQFPDHHNFSRSDLEDIADSFNVIHGRHKFIMTTEKDAVRIATNPYFPSELRQHIFYQPIDVTFIAENKEDFDSVLKLLLHNKQN